MVVLYMLFVQDLKSHLPLPRYVVFRSERCNALPIVHAIQRCCQVCQLLTALRIQPQLYYLPPNATASLVRHDAAATLLQCYYNTITDTALQR